MSVGKKQVIQNFVVADIVTCQGILGMDFLTQNRGKVDIEKKTLKLGKVKIWLKSNLDNGISRVQLLESINISPYTEAFVQCYLDRPCFLERGIVEPAKFLKGRKLLLAKTLVDPQNQVILSLVNLGEKPVKLDSETVIGMIYPVDSVCTLVPDCEHEKDTIEIPEHLKPLLENVSENLNVHQRSELKTLVGNYRDIFKDPEGSLGQTDFVLHEIDTGNARPIKLPLRRVPLKQREVIEDELNKMLQENIIEPSDSPWSSNICLVTKKDGSLRFCVDFRKLNQVTRKDAYPLPRIDDTLDTLTNSQWFSTLDLASGYWQIKMHPKDKPKTAFATHKGLFQFNVLPFGLSNGPASFQRLMGKVLGHLNWYKCLCYLDDVIVFGHNFETALANLESVFSCLRQANLKLKPSKCVLFQEQVQFLGHVVSKDGVQCDPAKIDAVKTWPRPENKSEVKSFLGLIGYYRRFVPNFSLKAYPLNFLTRSKSKFKWDERCEDSFNILKECLISAPILAFPNESDTFVLDTDASGESVGAVLSQIQSGEERVIAYASKTLNKSQQNYCTTKRELLAVVSFVRLFRHYLTGRKFILRTDHAPLLWLKNFKDPEGMYARWITILENFDFESQYRAGYKHRNADGLSRIPDRKCKNPDCMECVPQNSVDLTYTQGENHESCKPHHVDAIETELQPSGIRDRELPNWLGAWETEEISEMQLRDPGIKQILLWKLDGRTVPPGNEKHSLCEAAKSLCTDWEMLHVSDNVLYLKGYNHVGVQISRLVTPSEIRDVIFKNLHASRTGGHLGRDRMIEAIRRRFYWYKQNEDIKLWCEQCDMCARGKPGPGLGKSSLKQFQASAPMQVVAVDIVGPLPITDKNNEYIIVFGDYYTKWKEVFAVPNHSAMTVAEKLVTEVFCRFGCPEQIHSDQGREFESELFSCICNLLDIQKTRTTPYRPQSDGLVERFNRTLIQMLSICAEENFYNWDEHLPYLLMAYRSTEHSSTKCTPNLLMLGREINYPLDLMVGLPPEQRQVRCSVQYAQWMQSVFNKSFDLAHSQLGKAAKRQKKGYDKNLKPRKFEIGNWVWRWYPPKAGMKLGLGWTGPYLVVGIISEVTCSIQKSPQSPKVNVHIDHLKIYKGTHVPMSWLANHLPNIPEVLEDSEVTPDILEGPDVVNPQEQEVIGANVNQTRRGRVVKPRQIYSP
jgi:transposase InsO family protein